MHSTIVIIKLRDPRMTVNEQELQAQLSLAQATISSFQKQNRVLRTKFKYLRKENGNKKKQLQVMRQCGNFVLNEQNKQQKGCQTKNCNGDGNQANPDLKGRHSKTANCPIAFRNNLDENIIEDLRNQNQLLSTQLSLVKSEL